MLEFYEVNYSFFLWELYFVSWGACQIYFVWAWARSLSCFTFLARVSLRLSKSCLDRRRLGVNHVVSEVQAAGAWTHKCTCSRQIFDVSLVVLVELAREDRLTFLGSVHIVRLRFSVQKSLLLSKWSRVGAKLHQVLIRSGVKVIVSLLESALFEQSNRTFQVQLGESAWQLGACIHVLLKDWEQFWPFCLSETYNLWLNLHLV